MRSHRPEMVGGLLKRELAEILRRNANQFGGNLLTVTEVRLPHDLRNATVWVSVFNEAEQRKDAIKTLQRMSGMIRHQLAGRIHLRRIPVLTFKLDETLDTAQRIDSLLRQSGVEDNNKGEEERSHGEQSGTDS